MELKSTKKELVEKYVRDLEGLKKEVELYRQRFRELNLLSEEELAIYHELVIFLFSVIYKYLVFEHVPFFTGGKGLDAWIEHENTKICVEFEVCSSDFSKHRNNEKQECDMIVCWRDNSRKKHEFWNHIDIFELRHFWE